MLCATGSPSLPDDAGVLNGRPRVREETRSRVHSAIDALGYRRSLTARVPPPRHSQPAAQAGRVR
ncbi:MAG: LacI family DNA-binding transcriptional regulator [Nonomuraea sp.]|nr:LacI family DNA-binding transcriptional regulator [Nonomuraea sp.]NUP63368.1 LacI family DNA-binding transcriptional regulator [Nonomuraea sp.]